MDFSLHTENLRLTGDIEEFAQKKLSKLGRYLPNILSVHVEIEQQNSTRGPDVIIAQITLRHSRGAILRTEERVEKTDYNSVKTALSNASDKMYRRISRFKGKRRVKRQERYTMSPEELMIAEALPDEEMASENGSFEDEEIEETIIIEPRPAAASRKRTSASARTPRARATCSSGALSRRPWLSATPSPRPSPPARWT